MRFDTKSGPTVFFEEIGVAQVYPIECPYVNEESGLSASEQAPQQKVFSMLPIKFHGIGFHH